MRAIRTCRVTEPSAPSAKSNLLLSKLAQLVCGSLLRSLFTLLLLDFSDPLAILDHLSSDTFLLRLLLHLDLRVKFAQSTAKLALASLYNS